jgi:hypothetical protein
MTMKIEDTDSVETVLAKIKEAQARGEAGPVMVENDQWYIYPTMRDDEKEPEQLAGGHPDEDFDPVLLLGLLGISAEWV